MVGMGCKEPEQRVVLVPQQKLLAGECASQLPTGMCYAAHAQDV